MGTLHRLPAASRGSRSTRKNRRSRKETRCSGCGGPVTTDGHEPTYCSPECEAWWSRKGGDLVVRSQLARVVQAAEMLGTELGSLIDVLAATSERKGGRR